MNKHIHILGICGTFMGGLAILARQLGFTVTGSDQSVYPPMSDSLRAQGVIILEGYRQEHLNPRPDAVIIGNVCSRGNPAVEYVLNERIPYFSGPEWLAKEVLQQRHVIAVSGTHGKTTTTSLLTWVLTYAGLKPGYLIGGVANNFSATADLGQAPYFVIEADEYDSAFFDKRPKFLHYRPSTLIINNIEFDHADIYVDLAAIQQQFAYLNRTVAAKNLILTREHDANSQAVLAQGVWSRTDYFVGPNSSWQYKLLAPDASSFEVFYQGRSIGQVKWSLIGEHNVENAFAVLAAAKDIGIEPELTVKALNEFGGIKRRMELIGSANGIKIFDDFAHHPTAIKNTLQALRARIGAQRLIAILQLASNTMRLGKHNYTDLAQSLQEADQVVLLHPDNEHFDVTKLCEALRNPVQVYKTVDEIVADLSTSLQPNDAVLVMSNKSFGGLQQRLFASVFSKYNQLS